MLRQLEFNFVPEVPAPAAAFATEEDRLKRVLCPYCARVAYFIGGLGATKTYTCSACSHTFSI